MKKTESIIEVIADEIIPSQAQRDWANVTGQQEYPKPVYYRNRKTQEEYSWLEGTLAWSTETGVSNYAAIITVDKIGDDEPVFRIAEETEDQDVGGLIWKCADLQDKYGYWESQELLRFWHGDHERFSPLIDDIHVKLRKKYGMRKVFYITAPAGFRLSNSFEIYAKRIESLLKFGKKRLHIGHCNRVRNEISQFFLDSSANKKPEKYPAIQAVGSMLHTLMIREPWMESAGGPINIDDY